MSGPGHFGPELPQQCDECGEIRELRPYGPDGKVVCFECLDSHPEWAEEAQVRMVHNIAPILFPPFEAADA